MIRYPIGDFGRFPPPPEVSLLTNKNTYEFHVGGSHYFGVATETSDFDFITQYSSGVVKYLTDNGFVDMGPPEFEDDPEQEYNAPDAFGIFQLGRIQVQVVYDLEAVLKARDILAFFFNDEHRRLGKESRRLVWESMIKTVQLINSQPKML